ncbi:carbohydrate kinase [Microbispora triticiradicis]|uniref:Carbohydrate kinase n=1 Tax=Microbispora triticiradicis TaxID=2200763 RepID=A0ABX9LFW8_9ACTN|nr:carbohydrate kinase [Microbispora triticiradicis]RGA02740.1 carbohydrate kinase [Microbispora triticiradicis]GLW25954.1 ribokinase [Microbispora amethystogenes]
MTFLVTGESLVDLIGAPGSWTFTAVPGGSPLNVAVALAALGRPVRFAGETGDDLFGGLLRDHLTRHGIGTGDLAPAASTGLAFARVGADGSASYDFRFEWRLSAPVALDGVTCLHTGSLATLVAPGGDHVRALMRAAKAAGVTVSYDPNIRPSLAGDRSAAVALVEECVRLSRLVKVSAEDLDWLYPGEPGLDVARRWAGLGPELVVVTRGGDGATAVLRDWLSGDGVPSEGVPGEGVPGDEVITCPAPAVEVVDTVGAGDTFTAAYLDALHDDALHGKPLPDGALTPARVAEALRRGCAAAAIVCTRAGAVPPTRAEVNSFSLGTGLSRAEEGHT